MTIDNLRGMTPDLAAALKGLGIRNNEQLLRAAATPKLRRELADRIEADPRGILELANRADLARVSGIGGVYADLLEQAGVDTVKELAQRRPDNLHQKLLATNDAKRLAKVSPPPAKVADWVQQAKALDPLLQY
jgi:predicted flap endonuclease-1-like 5' DNA nuclease